MGDHIEVQGAHGLKGGRAPCPIIINFAKFKDKKKISGH